MLDFSRHVHQVLEIDPQRRLARVEPGAILDDLRARAEQHGLTFGPDPATHAHCTLGGMIGNDSCGVHSVLARFEGEGGRTADNVAELEIVTYDGVRMRVGKTTEEDLARIVAEGGRRGQIYASLRELRDRYAGKIREKYPKIPAPRVRLQPPGAAARERVPRRPRARGLGRHVRDGARRRRCT